MEKGNMMYLGVKKQLGGISSHHVDLRDQTQAAGVMNSPTILQAHEENF